MANGEQMLTVRWSCNADHDHTLDVADCDPAMQAIITEMLEIVHDVPGPLDAGWAARAAGSSSPSWERPWAWAPPSRWAP